MRLCPSCGDNSYVEIGHHQWVCQFCSYEGHTSEQNRHIGRRVQTTANGRPRQGARVLLVVYDDEDES
jgi:hypothetical protein